MKKLLLFAALILSLAARAADDEVYLYAEPITIEAGGTATLKILCESGTKTCIGFQAYFTLPEGISVNYAYDEDEEDDVPQILKGARLKTAHNVSYNYSEGMWKTVVGSLSNATFKSDKTNPVMLIELVADKELAAGTYNIKLSNVELGDEDGITPYRPIERNLVVTVNNGAAEEDKIIPGDINRDKDVDVYDYVILLNYIGKGGNYEDLTERDRRLYDVNGDGMLNVADCVATVIAIMRQVNPDYGK